MGGTCFCAAPPQVTRTFGSTWEAREGSFLLLDADLSVFPGPGVTAGTGFGVQHPEHALVFPGTRVGNYIKKCPFSVSSLLLSLEPNKGPGHSL